MPLALTNVGFGYDAHRPVLRDVSLELAPGGVTAIVGPNGGGKSTLLRLMAGVREPASGTVTLDGRAVSSIPLRQRAGRLAYLSQKPEVAFAYTVRQYVALGLYAAGSSADDGAVARALETVELRARAGDLFGVLSAGQQQRAALGRVLAQLEQPAPGAVLLADEPVAAMDPRHALATLGLFRTLAASGVAVAVVLHDLNLATRFCDRALVLDGTGQVAAAGPSGEVLKPGVLDSVFGVRFRTLADPAEPWGGVLVAAPATPIH